MNKELPESQYKRIIFRTIPSRQMREFLCLPENMLNCFGLAEIIIGSPAIDIYEKYELLAGLDKTENISSNKVINDYKEAIDNLSVKTGELFTVSAPFYDEEIKEIKYSSSVQPCTDYEKVLEYIEWNSEFEELDGYSCCWYQIEKWIHDEGGKYIKTYIYQYVLGVGICWFTSCEESKYGICCPRNNTKYSSQCIHLNLPTPFKPGDIVRIDCRPFAPPVNALLVYSGPDWDCCSLLALFKSADGEYRSGAVKHADMWWSNSGIDLSVSPLYRIEIYKGVYDYDCLTYKALSMFIDGINEKGNKILELGRIGITDPDELFKKAKELFKEEI